MNGPIAMARIRAPIVGGNRLKVEIEDSGRDLLSECCWNDQPTSGDVLHLRESGMGLALQFSDD
jgi:hypothetical protein